MFKIHIFLSLYFTDPRFPFESENVLKNLENQLESSVDARRTTTIGNTGIDVNTNLEITFIFDLSENVTSDELQDTIEFAETYFSKVNIKLLNQSVLN